MTNTAKSTPGPFAPQLGHMFQSARLVMLLAAFTLPVVVGAQQLKPFSVDRTSVQNGLLIYKGVSYISLDLLLKAGATANKQGLFVYTQPLPGGPLLKLSGCLNQKLYNNAFYLTVQAPHLNAAPAAGQSAVWEIPIVAQPIGDLRIENAARAIDPDVDLNEALLIYKDGSRFSQKTMPIGTATSRTGLGYFPAKQITGASLFFNKDENETEGNPPVKLILPQAHVPYKGTFPGFTIDLTCTK